MTNFVIYFDIAALVLFLALAVEFSVKRTISSRQTRAFLHILVVAMLASIFDIASSWGISNIAVVPFWAVQALLICYNLTFQGMGPIYYYYVIIVCADSDKKLDKRTYFLIFWHYMVTVLLIILTPSLGLLYRFDSDLTYQQGPLIYWVYYAGLFYLVSALVHTLRSKHIPRNHKVIIVIYTMIVVATMVVQFFLPHLLLINFGMAIGILLVSFTRENPLYYESQTLNAYNRNAFQTIVSKKVCSTRPFIVMGLKVEGLKELTELVGSDAINATLDEVAQFLISMAERDKVYYISGTKFALIVEGGPAEMEMFAKKIKKRFIDPFDVSNEKVHLQVDMTRFDCPEDASTSDAIINLLEYSLLKIQDNKGEIVHAEAGLLEERQRAGQVLQALRQAILDKSFTVHYQPIYSVEKDAFTSAEAYVYLFDKDLGFIPPSEFIPIAEKNGLITAIGEFVFEDTCRFMTENQVWDMGIEYIAVNLSPMQCIQEDLHIKLSAIMDKYRLDYFRISLEITDPAGIMKGKTLGENMQVLINKGMRFSLDDYGVGYANLNTVMEYPFSIVKLDRSMLWNAMKSDKAMTILRQTIRMMKQLSMELIAVGVETEEQAQLLAYYGCDFFQGYYYAKPMTAEDFLKFVADYMMKKSEKAEEQ